MDRSVKLIELWDDHVDRFGVVQYEVWSPGRINLIGEHTDYNNGFVLPAAIDRGITLYFSFPEGSDLFEMYSQNIGSHQSFAPDDPPLPKSNWAKYLQALVHVIRDEEGIQVPCFQVSLQSSIPTGGGLSSSAALCAGFVMAINHHGNHQWSIKRMARLAQYTEHRIGVRVGIMDPYAILAGQKNHFTLIDCRTDEYTEIAADMQGHVLLLMDTGIAHDLADSEYNVRRKACENVLAAAKSFREIDYVSEMTLKDLERVNVDFPELSIDEVEFVLEENQRVLDVVKALNRKDIEKVGALMYQSHTGLRDQYRVSCEELDFLVDLARKYGLPGARMMGGGFGGSTINLLPETRVNDFVDFVTMHYEKNFGKIPSFIPVHPSDGAYVRTF